MSLFTKSKEKVEAAQAQLPRQARYDCVARVGINGFEGEAALRNISEGGFLMESKTYAAIGVGERYTMRIKPEAESGIDPFELSVEVRWIRSAETKFSSGFLILDNPVGRSFQQYIEHIKTTV
jgi:hypothetical protein